MKEKIEQPDGSEKRIRIMLADDHLIVREGLVTVLSEEWVNFSERIQEHFRNNHENYFDEFYFWDDFSGDRTLDLKIAKPSVLTSGLLSDLQQYVQLHGQKMWRIRIPVYFKPNDPHRVIVIYPHAIDIPPLCELTAAESLGCANCIHPGRNGDSARTLDFRVKTPCIHTFETSTRSGRNPGDGSAAGLT